jgi:hypothetical protein
MRATKSIRILTVIIMAYVSSLLNSGFTSVSVENYLNYQLEQGSLSLHVKPIQQKKITSCGEAVITMAYNYAYSQAPLEELDVIAFSMKNGYYIDDRPPFTSPANMVKIAKHYTNDLDQHSTDGVDVGTVITQEQGLKLLMEKLKKGEPVIIDVLTQLNNRYSGAHFVLVTGISMDSKHTDVVIIHYNDSLTAHNESASWSGHAGVWNAWQNNGDPGGAGWWLVIPPPEKSIRVGQE